MAKKRRRGRPRKNPIFKNFNKDSKIKRVSHLIPLLTLISSIIMKIQYDFPLYNPNFTFGGLIPFIIIMGFIYLFVYAFLDFNDLTNNVKANKFLSPFVFLGVLLYTHFHLKIILFSPEAIYSGSIMISFIFTFVYMYSSEYFQPDLDLHSRPGTSHFPLGKWIAYWRTGRFLKWLTKPLNLLWNWMWTPFANMFTHRGLSHWPIISVYLRISYLYIIFFPINYFLHDNYISLWINMFFPWNENFMSLDWIIFCLPVFLSDIIHILVDYIDAVKRGMPFCPSRIPRGLFANIWDEIKNEKK